MEVTNMETVNDLKKQLEEIKRKQYEQDMLIKSQHSTSFADSVKRTKEYSRQMQQDKDFFDYMCELKGDVKKYKKKYKKLKARVKKLEDMMIKITSITPEEGANNE